MTPWGQYGAILAMSLIGTAPVAPSVRFETGVEVHVCGRAYEFLIQREDRSWKVFTKQELAEIGDPRGDTLRSMVYPDGYAYVNVVNFKLCGGIV